MQTITFNDANDIVIGVTLEDVQYKLRLMWNAFAKSWNLQIWDANRVPILQNVQLVPNFPVLMTHHRPGIPPGEILAITDAETLSRDCFVDGSATLCYVPEAEWYGTV